MRPSDRNGIAVIIAVALACLTVRPLTVDANFVILSWLLIALLGGIGIGLRRSRFGGSTVLAAQSVGLVLFSLALSGMMPISGLRWFENYAALWAVGVEHMRVSSSPMEPNEGVLLIFVTVVGIIMIMTDLLVSGLGRPAWALAPPATLFLVPALGLGIDIGIANFCFIAIGYLGILVAEGLNTTARWTRGLSRDSADGFGTASPVVWRATGYLAVPALVGAIVLGAALPTLSLPGFGFGSGPGSGPLQLTDPTLDLRRNLNQPDDRVVLEYQSETAGGLYLRMATLPQLNASGWSNVLIRLSTGNELSPVPGLAEEPERRRTEIRVFDFGSQYLPLPYAPRTFEADGDWRFDPNSLVVVNASDRPQELRQLSYRVESVDIEPDSEQLADAAVGTPPDSDITAAIPRDLPESLIEQSREVTEDADTPLEKAVAIQTFLRSGEFEYSTERLPGSGYEALENFLLRDRRGYCEQFASAMAMMARVAGIPSRVSVGFLPGEREGDSWTVSIRDMHAWPELYFANHGWVRFEPTPASVTGSAPPWSLQPEDDPTEDPTADPSAEETTGPSATDLPPDELPEDTSTDDATTATWGRTLLLVAGSLVLLLILAAPATIRVRRRTARLSGEGDAAEQVEGAWAEIRDTVLDHGGSWPEGSPRAIGREIGNRLEHEEASSMGQVATLVERSRYARTFEEDPAAARLPAATQEIRRGIAVPATLPRKILAVLLPRSLFRRRRH